MTSWINWDGHAVKILDAIDVASKTMKIKIECKTNGVVFDTPERSIMLVWDDLRKMSAAELARVLTQA